MRIIALLFVTILTSCQYYNGKLPVAKTSDDTTLMVNVKEELPPGPDTAIPGEKASATIATSTAATGNTTPEQLLSFAKTLIGVPYKYGSTDPALGFDCSGFITYVFNHFNIKVPRSSIDFTNYGTNVKLNEAKIGDLILFTGTDSAIREVGHMGIISSVKDDAVDFIHSTSGKANGVTITSLNKYYLGRFVKVIRAF